MKLLIHSQTSTEQPLKFHRTLYWACDYLLYPPPHFNKVEREVYWFHVVCPSVCGQNCICSIKNLKFWQILGICNFDFVLLWHWIWYESMVWVVMGRRRVSSERRHSSCSSLCWDWSQTMLVKEAPDVPVPIKINTSKKKSFCFKVLNLFFLHYIYLCLTSS